MQHSTQCFKCGGPSHARAECPANDTKCRGCGKKGHYQRVCRNKAVVACIEEEERKSFFLGSVTCKTNKWEVDVQIKEKRLKFKLDTGADVTAISESDLKDLYPGAQRPVLHEPEKPLLGPGKIQLGVVGYAKMQLTYKAKQTEEKVYVVKNLGTPLLGLPAIIALGILIRVDMPTHPSELQPELPDRSLLFQKERVKRMTDAANFNRRHRAKPLGSLSSGQNVWITDTQTSGTVIQSHTSPRSYLVDAPHGVVRRNRMHLIPLQSPAQDEGGQQQQEPLPVLEQDHAPPAVGSPVHSPGVSIPRTTRSGRVIKQPTRLNL
ncbi:unnamed protein product [Menidia menidia]|uniref:(Atlantic silverside) hypothetical protein n=1 Tax=Menidia menidia TaxID=238744 RepID=A0A8S4BI39_9TELE|nr:unnamed protein product [Menidia menidia]